MEQLDFLASICDDLLCVDVRGIPDLGGLGVGVPPILKALDQSQVLGVDGVGIYQVLARTTLVRGTIMLTLMVLVGMSTLMTVTMLVRMTTLAHVLTVTTLVRGTVGVRTINHIRGATKVAEMMPFVRWTSGMMLMVFL